MLKEGPAPMAADETCAENVILNFEMGGDKAKDIKREAVDESKRVLQFAGSCKGGQNVPFELRNLVRGRAEGWLACCSSTSSEYPSTYSGGYAVHFNSSLRAKTSCDSDNPFPG